MVWNKYRFSTKAELEDIVIATLAEAGVEGVEIEDHIPLTAREKEQMFVEILPETGEDDGMCFLSFYIDTQEDPGPVLAAVNEALDELRLFADIGPCRIEKSSTEDVDWINNWKQYFHQFTVDDILITPSWEEVSAADADKLVIHIDPGTAFGTGMHETTQLCIRQLKKYVRPGADVLDVGTGSGILSIIALKLGAGHAVGTDLDPCAVSAARENLEANGLSEQDMDVMIGNLIGDREVAARVGFEKYDVVCANILADVLTELTPYVVPCMKKGAVYITSGILEEKEELVRDAMTDAGLTVLDVSHQGEWVSVTGMKP